MRKSLHVLIVEDSEDDALLLLRELKRGGYEPTFERVFTAKAMKAALDKQTWDIVISDYVMPRFSGLDALEVLHKSGLDIPFIIVSGKIGEDVAVEAMKAGAHDFIAKGNLTRLNAAIERELREAETRHKRKLLEKALIESERRYSTIVEKGNDGIIIIQDGELKFANQKATEITGFPLVEVIGKMFTDFISPAFKKPVLAVYKKRMKGEKVPDKYEIEILSKDGKVIPAEISASLIEYQGKPADLAIIRDITERKKSEKEILRLALFPKLNPMPILELDQTSRVVYANDAMSALFPDISTAGPDHPVISGLQSFLVERQHDGKKSLVREVTMKGLVYNLMIHFVPETETIRIYALDITERKRVEDKLHASESRYRMLIETMNEGLSIIDKDDILIYANDKYCEILGRSRDELIGHPLAHFTDKRDHDLLQKQLVRQRKGERVSYEPTYISKDGRKVFTTVSATPVFDADGDYNGGFAVVADITERKKAEEALEESEQRFRSIFENASDGILIVKMENKKFFSGNKMICRMLGYNPDEIKNLRVMDIHHEKDLPHVIDQFEKQLRGEISLAEAIPVKRKDGSVFYADINSFQITFAGETYLVGSFRDITDRKLVEEKVRESEEKYRSLVESSVDAIYMLDKDLRYISANKALQSRLGLSKDEIVGKPFSDFHSPEETVELSVLSKGVIETGKAVQQEHWVDRLGRAFLRTLSPVKDSKTGEIKTITVVSKDITASKIAEETVKQAAEEWTRTFNAMTDLIFILDKDFTITCANKAVAEVFKAKPEDIVGKKCYELFHKLTKPWLGCPFEMTLKDKNPHIVEVDDPNIGIPLLVSNSPIFNEKGDIVGAVHVARNITERKNAEKSLRESIYKMNYITLGECYLIPSRDTAYRLFAQLVLHGVLGLCISREKPDKLIQHGIPKEKIVVMSSVPMKGFETIDDLQKVSMRMSDFLKENNESVIMLDGLEYLISRSSFETVYKFIQEKRFSFIEPKANLFIPIDLATLTEKERALLISEVKLLG